MKRLWRVLRWAGALILVMVLLVSVGGYVFLRQSLPDASGTLTIAGLQGPVEIIRDSDGIPHIYAQDRRDAMVGLGYVHAQDRLWQIEFQRRLGQGRLSEIVGPDTISVDIFMRTVGLGRAAERAWERFPAAERPLVEGYAAGINAFLATHSGSSLPPEFAVFGDQPAPWDGPDVLVWAKMMALDLGGTFEAELLRLDLAQALGPERADQLMPPSPADELSVLPAQSQAGQVPPSTALEPSTTATGDYLGLLELAGAARRLANGPQDLGRAVGSNSWVVDGSKSTTGKPLLANDTHLGSRQPSTWYLAHLSTGDSDVVGATIPGLPGVVVGHNRSIAWGVTNLLPDVQDLFRERLSDDGQQVMYQGRMEPLQIITETIQVKGMQPIQQIVRISRHGPLLSDALNTMAEHGSDPKPPTREPLALRWTALDDDDATVASFLRINAATDWASFQEALRDYVAPGLGMTYADSAGTIGYYASGRIPLHNGGDGRLPAEGWTGDQEWTGWVPFEEMPHLENPPSHIIVTANNRPAGGAYPYLLGHDWDPPYRAQRISERLQAQQQLSPEDMVALQGDTVSLQARSLLPRLLGLVRPTTEAEQRAVTLLQGWDYNAAGDSAAAAIYESWLARLPRAIVEDELEPVQEEQYLRWFDTFVSRFLDQTLAQPDSPWCDRITTSPRETCADLAQQTFQETLATLTSQHGADMARWRWDQLHTVIFPHQPFDDVDVLRDIFSRHTTNGGDYSTVNVGPFTLDGQFRQYTVPGYRQVVDLADMGAGQFIQAIGPVGPCSFAALRRLFGGLACGAAAAHAC